jgi:hypothetical protein
LLSKENPGLHCRPGFENYGLHNQEGAAAGSNFNLAGCLCFAAEAGQFVIFAQEQFTSVEQHGAAAQLAVAGEGIDFGLTGQSNGGDLGGVVDDEIAKAFLAVLKLD